LVIKGLPNPGEIRALIKGQPIPQGQPAAGA